MQNSQNLLHVQFKRTHSLHLSSAIKSYISAKYDQHPDTFARDLEIIDQLRKDAVAAVEPHSGGLRKIQAYTAQLVWMGGKFPVDVSSQSNEVICITCDGLADKQELEK